MDRRTGAPRQDVAQLLTEQELSSAIFESTGAIIIVLTPEGEVVRFNPAAERLTGWSFEELRAAGWEVLVPEPERALARERLAGLRGGTLPPTSTVHWETRSGRLVPIAWSRAVTRDPDGHVNYIIATGIDISTLQASLQQLRTARQAYRRLLEFTCDMVLTQAPDGTILDINGAGARMLGAEGPEEIVGLHLGDIVYPDDLAIAMEGLARTLQEGERRLSSEGRHLTRDGRTVDVEVIASAATSWYGQPAVQTVVRDVTERKLAQLALKTRERFFESLAQVAPVGIFLTDLHGQCIYANRQYLEITGHTPEETMGHGWWEHMVPEDREAVRGQWQRMVEGGGTFRMEYRLRRRDGAVIWVLGQAAPEPGEGGAAAGYVGSIIDVHQGKLDEIELRNYREHLEEMVRERTIELEAVNRELESFAYSVSHDLRAPLRAINGFNGALLEEYGHKLDDDGRYFLRRVQANTRQMAQLIDDMLQLSKVTQADLEREWVDLSRLAAEIVGELRQVEPGRAVEFRVAPDLMAFGDRQLLSILLQNLLGNAWKYTGRNAGPAVIEFGATEAGGTRTFHVRDNGAGFDMACTPHLFRAFQRFHDASQFEGTGIGLATAHRVVTRHGGRIWATAEEGKGATFFFVLD